MLALYRTGRQAEALRRCADLRSMLRDELGLSLSPAARDLEARILADDPSLHHHVEQPTRVTPVPLARREPTQLIGRADDIAALREELDRRPIVTIIGPGGVGKTRLAMTVADACADGFAQVVVVELASLRDPDATVQLIAERARRRATSASHAGANDRGVHPRPGGAARARQLRARPGCRRSSGPAPQSSLPAAHRAGDRSCALGPARRVRPRARTARRAGGWSGRRRGSIRCRRAAVRRPSRRGTSGIPARRAQPGRGGGDLPQARRPASGDRAGGREDALDRGRSPGGPPRSALRPARRPVRRASTRGTAASISSSNGPTSCSTPSTSKPSPTWRRSPAASISKQPKSCAGDAGRPRAPGTCRDRPGRQVDGAGGRSRGAAVPAAGDVARLRPGATPGDRSAGAGRGAPSRVVRGRGRAGCRGARHLTTRGDGSRGSTATSTTSAPPTPAPWPPATSPSPAGWWPPFASTRSGECATRSPAGERPRCRWRGSSARPRRRSC